MDMKKPQRRQELLTAALFFVRACGLYFEVKIVYNEFA